MVRAIVLYDEEPDPARYEQHAELCRNVPGASFHHGPVFGAPMGDPPYRYYAEWQWPDRESFESAARASSRSVWKSKAFSTSGRLSVIVARGGPFS